VSAFGCSLLPALPTLGSLTVFSDPNCVKVTRAQVRFPRSKKRRMREKWAKQEKNWRTTYTPTAYIHRHMLIAHPSLIDALQRELRSLQPDLGAAYFGRTCVRCSNDVDVDELAETRLGPMHRDCADKAEAEGVFGPVDHGDSLWPR